MRPRFERDVQVFSDIAKDEIKPGERTLAELKDLSKVLDWHLNKAAEGQHTNVETQKQIYEIQKKKQRIMQRLKEKLACLDRPDCRVEPLKDERSAHYDETTKRFRYTDDRGKARTASFGELMTDMNWGLNYALDAQTPRLWRKKYVIERAKTQLQELLDSQIIKSEVGGDIAHEYKQQAYRAVEEERKSGELKERSGFIAEIVVKNFLKQLSLDKRMPFEIRDANVFQDVEQKIDFIIHRKDYRRGVNVEMDERAQDVGIQFTMNMSAVEKKRTQIERSVQQLRRQGDRIQDIALVVFPLTMARSIVQRWKQDGRSAGGPEKFLTLDTAKHLFFELLNNVLTAEEIEQMWESVRDRYMSSDSPTRP